MANTSEPRDNNEVAILRDAIDSALAWCESVEVASAYSAADARAAASELRLKLELAASIVDSMESGA